MNPKDLLVRNIENHIRHNLERIGFNFSKAKIVFEKNNKGFIQTFTFCLSNGNGEDCCEFWTSWSIRSQEYSKWHLKQYGIEAPNDSIWLRMDWDIPGWSVGAGHYQLKNITDDKLKIDQLKRDILERGIPELAKNSNWNQAAKAATEDAPFYLKACELYLIAGNLQDAKAIAETGIKRIKEGELPDQLGQLQNLEKLVGQISLENRGK